MTADPWQEVRRELDRWAHQGLRARFWLRDDDACEMSAQLMRLRALADRFDLNIGLAVIPGKVRPAFVRDVLGLRDKFEPMCHGWNHIDYGRPGMPEEFGDGRPFSTVCRDAEQAYKVFSDCFGASLRDLCSAVQPNHRGIGERTAPHRICGGIDGARYVRTQDVAFECSDAVDSALQDADNVVANSALQCADRCHRLEAGHCTRRKGGRGRTRRKPAHATEGISLGKLSHRPSYASSCT